VIYYGSLDQESAEITNSIIEVNLKNILKRYEKSTIKALIGQVRYENAGRLNIENFTLDQVEECGKYL